MALTKYSQSARDAELAGALNMLGLLQHWLGLFTAACTSYAAALQAGGIALAAANVSTVRMNLARAMVDAGRHAEAVQLYASLDPASFAHICGFALAGYVGSC